MAIETELAGLTNIVITILEAMGAILALLAVVVIFIAILKSIWKVTAGRATLILPFRGAEKLGVFVSGVLAQQIDEIERIWPELSKSIQMELDSKTKSDTLMLVDLGSSKPDVSLDKDQDYIISSDPLEGQAIGNISFGAVSFSPESLFIMSYQARAVLARRTIRGTVDQFGDTVRLSTTLTFQRDRGTTMILVKSLEKNSQLLDLIDDMAFEISKHRLGMKTESKTWGGYRHFLEGYAYHLHFEQTGDVAYREMAIEKYQQSIGMEPDYYLAHYNVGTLLYNRYTADDNVEAIKHFKKASETSREILRAIAFGELARSYCQQVHRYGQKKELWLPWAEEASAKAVQLAPDLSETWLARAFTLQLLGHYQEALEGYQRVDDLPGDSLDERGMKSHGQNNSGYVYMTVYGDLEKALIFFNNALELNKNNKITYANLGEVYKRMKQYKKAINAYQTALNLDSRYINAHNEMGMVYLAMVRDDLNDIHQPHNSELLDLASQCHNRAVSLVPDKQYHHLIELHRRFAEAYQEYGFPQDAEKELNEVKSLSRMVKLEEHPV